MWKHFINKKHSTVPESLLLIQLGVLRSVFNALFSEEGQFIIEICAVFQLKLRANLLFSESRAWSNACCSFGLLFLLYLLLLSKIPASDHKVASFHLTSNCTGHEGVFVGARLPKSVGHLKSNTNKT